MTRQIVKDGRYAYMVLVGGVHTVPMVLVRRTDLRSSKWSSGNVTPAGRVRALELAGITL